MHHVQYTLGGGVQICLSFLMNSPLSVFPPHTPLKCQEEGIEFLWSRINPPMYWNGIPIYEGVAFLEPDLFYTISVSYSKILDVAAFRHRTVTSYPSTLGEWRHDSAHHSSSEAMGSPQRRGGLTKWQHHLLRGQLHVFAQRQLLPVREMREGYLCSTSAKAVLSCVSLGEGHMQLAVPPPLGKAPFALQAHRQFLPVSPWEGACAWS